MRKFYLVFSAIALLCCGAFGQSSGLPDANAVHVVAGKADKAFELSDGSTPASQTYVLSAIAGVTGTTSTTTTNQTLGSKVMSKSAPSKICAAVAGINGSVFCGGVTGTPLSITVQTGLNTPILNTVGATNSVAQYGLNVNSSANTQILLPSSVGGSVDQATVFTREMWFEGGSNLSGVDNWENDTYDFDKADQWEFMLGWQCNRHNTGFWQYDNFKHGWTNTSVPCSIVSGHIYHYILTMHRDAASSTACSGTGSDSSVTAGPCEYWDTFKLDDVTASTTNTYTLNAKLVAEPASLGSWQTWDGVGGQVQLDVVDSTTGGSSTLVSMYVDDDTLTVSIPVTSSGGGSTSTTETTGNLGEYDFDSSTPASGLTSTGAPTVDNTNSYTPANAVLFNAGAEYYDAPITASGNTVYWRGLINVTTSSANSTQFVALYNGSSQLFNLFFNAGNGFITSTDVASSATTTCASAALSTGAWHTVEFAWTKGSGTAGSYKVLIDSTQTCSVTGTNTGTALPTKVRFGELSSPASPWVFDMDNVGISSTGLLGPVTATSVPAAPLYDLAGSATAVQATSLQAANNLSDIANLGQTQINLGLLASAFFPVVGTDTNIPTSDGLTGGAAALVCMDANNGLTTTGCPGGSGATTLQTAGTNNTSQSALNFIASTVNAAGLTATPSNPTGSSEKIEITGSPTTLNGGTVPASAAVVGSNSSSQPIAATGHQIHGTLVCADTSASGTAQSCSTAPSFTPAANDCVVYTTTTANSGTGLTLNVNSLGAKSVAKWLGSTTLAAGDVKTNSPQMACYTGTVWNLSTIGNAPSGGGGGGSFTDPGTTLGDIYYDTGTPSMARLAGPTSGAVPYYLCSTPSSGTATAPAWCLAGIAGRAVSGTTDTVVAADRGSTIRYTSSSATAAAFTSPATLSNNFDVVVVNTGTGTVTFTLGAGNFLTASGSATTLALASGQNCAMSSPDNTNIVPRCSTPAAAAGISNIQITVGTTLIPANSCLPSSTTYNTATMTGLATTSTVTISPAGSLAAVAGWTATTPGLYFNGYGTANTLNWQICNGSTTSNTPGASTTWNVSAK